MEEPHISSSPSAIMRKNQSAKSPQPIPDPRLFEQMIREVQRLLGEQEFATMEEANAFFAAPLGGRPISSRTPTTPLERALSLVDEAIGSDDEARCEALARQALEISPDAADAWTLLAESAKSPRESHDLYVNAIAAAERVLGDDREALSRDGHLWLSIEGRPLLRARLGLAITNWNLGDRPRAIEQAWEILGVNPNDNQGVRYVLLGWLLRAGSLEQIERLLTEYRDDASAAWCFNGALHRFRTEGPSPRARSDLQAALRSNPFVAEFLLGRRAPPEDVPQLIGFGDETEAIAYVEESLTIWADTPGALAWLEERMDAARRGRKRTKARRKPTGR